MRTLHLVAIGAASLLLNSLTHAVTLDLVPVGNPGNPANANGLGSVPYSYQISRTEVSNAQYVEFLNAVDPTGANTRSLYSTSMSTEATVSDTGGIDLTPGNPNGSKYSVKPGKANNPVIHVSWNDAARFTNWLHNGQGAGSTESGVYNMSVPDPVRSAGATYALPNQDEWIKAGHFDPNKNGLGPGYWTYATKSDSAPTSTNAPGIANPPSSANFLGAGGYAVTGSNSFDPNQNYLTDVGAYTSSVSFYSTRDQNGNVFEWDETGNDAGRQLRGGSWQLISLYLPQTQSISLAPGSEGNYIGFRVALVPEPAFIGLVGLLVPFVTRRRRDI